MRDRAGFLAVCADSLTEMCLYYAAAGILIMGRRWGVHLFWLLLWAALCCAVFALYLKKSRPFPALAALTAVLGLAGLGLFALASATPLGFGYGFVLAVGAGMAVGLPLYFTLHRPKVLAHLTQLDVLIGAMLLMLLIRDAMGVDTGTIALTALALLLDAAAAVGLRMSEGGGTESGSAESGGAESGGAESGSAFKASMVALVSAAVLALVIGLLSLLFSRSGSVTGGLLHGIGAFFSSIGSGVEGLVGRLAALLAREEHFEALDPGAELPSVAEAELSGGGMDLSVNTTVLGIALCALAVMIAAALVLLMRKRRMAAGTAELAADTEAGVLRTGGTAGVLWQRLRQAIAFRWTAFVRRDTPAGLLVLLERRGARARSPRGTGETMRAFLGRMDPEGGLKELADALDRQYYGGGGGLSPRRCREMRKYIRRTLRPGARSREAAHEQ